MDPIGERRPLDPVDEGGACARPCAVVHFKVGADLRQPLRHAQNRCYSNSTRKQQRPLCRYRKLEPVTRLADSDAITAVDRFVQGDGSTARIRAP